MGNLPSAGPRLIDLELLRVPEILKGALARAPRRFGAVEGLGESKKPGRVLLAARAARARGLRSDSAGYVEFDFGRGYREMSGRRVRDLR